MRPVIGMGVAAALMMGPNVSAEASRTPSTTPSVSTRKTGGDHIPAEWKTRTSLRVLPHSPRQRNIVRIFAHCPKKANHAIIGSTAFTLKGSRRLYREVGLGLSDRGLGTRSASISYYALLGFHQVCMECVKVTIDQETRLRRIQVIGRDSAPLRIRRFRAEQFFD